MSARISGNHHILLPVSFSVARFFPQFTLGGHQRRSIFLLADTGTEFITSSFDSRTVLADKNELTIFGNGNGIYPVGILKNIILGI